MTKSALALALGSVFAVAIATTPVYASEAPEAPAVEEVAPAIEETKGTSEAMPEEVPAVEEATPAVEEKE